MDSKYRGPSGFAPGGSYGPPPRLPGRDHPRLDDHVVQPETREEMLNGELIQSMPAKPPHGDQHFRLDYVIGAHLSSGYIGSTDMLTRTSEKNNFATDTCIRKAGIDPQTDERYLEEVAFEVVHEQTWKDITDRAKELTKRGVRRVFAIFVKKKLVCEWSVEGARWVEVRPDEPLEDPCFSKPLTVAALLDAAAADDAVARALLAKKNPVLKNERKKALKKGFVQAQNHALLIIFEQAVSRPLTEAERIRLKKRCTRVGFEQMTQVCFQRRGEALIQWLDED